MVGGFNEWSNKNANLNISSLMVYMPQSMTKKIFLTTMYKRFRDSTSRYKGVMNGKSAYLKGYMTE